MDKDLNNLMLFYVHLYYKRAPFSWYVVFNLMFNMFVFVKCNLIIVIFFNRRITSKNTLCKKCLVSVS